MTKIFIKEKKDTRKTQEKVDTNIIILRLMIIYIENKGKPLMYTRYPSIPTHKYKL